MTRFEIYDTIISTMIGERKDFEKTSQISEKVAITSSEGVDKDMVNNYNIHKGGFDMDIDKILEGLASKVEGDSLVKVGGKIIPKKINYDDAITLFNDGKLKKVSRYGVAIGDYVYESCTPIANAERILRDVAEGEESGEYDKGSLERERVYFNLNFKTVRGELLEKVFGDFMRSLPEDRHPEMCVSTATRLFNKEMDYDINNNSVVALLKRNGGAGGWTHRRRYISWGQRATTNAIDNSLYRRQEEVA